MLFKSSIEKFVEHLRAREKSEETITGYRNALRRLDRHLEAAYNCPPYIDDVEKDEIESYLGEMKSRGCAATTRNRLVFVLRSYFNFAVEDGLAASNPAEEIHPVKARRKERTYLTRGEVQELAGAIAHPVVRAAVLTAYFTGLRPSELLSLTLDDLDLEAGILHVRCGKGNKDRDLPVCAELEKIIAAYLGGERPEVESENLFATAQSGGLSLQYFNRKIGEAVEDLGWKKDVTAHVLRHSFASRLVARDVNIAKIQKLLGHSSIKVTAVYAHSNMEALSDAVSEL